MTPDTQSNRTALRIALAYLVFGLAYIYLSDVVVLGLVSESETLTRLQTAKGFAFITSTALFLYLITRSVLRSRSVEYTHRLKLQADALQAHEETIRAFVTMIDARDSYTAGHTRRVALYCGAIARRMGFSAEEVAHLTKAAEVHDIGKIHTPDAVLLKPRPLTSREYELVKNHLTVDYTMLKEIGLYREIAEIMRYHHERYDGTGYPQGVSGEQIPLLAHVMIVADALDAMTSNRVYRLRKTFAEAFAELTRESGKQFHPRVVEAALEIASTLPQDQPAPPAFPLKREEVERMAYFYRDQLTGCYNHKYLAFVLQNRDEFPVPSESYIRLHGLEKFNERRSWSAGDTLLRDFSGALQQCCPQALHFRLNGNVFVVFSEQAIQDAILEVARAFPEVTIEARPVSPGELQPFVHQVGSTLR